MKTLDFKSTLNIIKSKVTMNEVLSSYGVNISSSKLILCPLHSEKTGSFKIYNGDSGEGSFWCFGCLKGGDMLTFVELFEGISKSEALQRLTSKFKIDLVTREYSNNLLASVEEALKPKELKKPDICNFLRVASDCNVAFAALNTAEITPYMAKKKIPHIGTKSKGMCLVVPVCDDADNIWSLQYIYVDGTKMFHPEGRRKGCMYRIGPHPGNEGFAYLAEGYATGASVYLATGKTVYVCFTSGNIIHVYRALKTKFPQMELIVAGDNDAAGKNHGLLAVYPSEEGKDWNDVWIEEGPQALAQTLQLKQVVQSSTSLASAIKNALTGDHRVLPSHRNY